MGNNAIGSRAGGLVGSMRDVLMRGTGVRGRMQRNFGKGQLYYRFTITKYLNSFIKKIGKQIINILQGASSRWNLYILEF